jgi:predicted regulator of Ras-like GTPase activity (Roadblock/LC7/MglB family)
MTERGGDGSTGDLDRVVAELRGLSGDIESCGVLSQEGELLSSSHGEGVERERVPVRRERRTKIAARVARQDGKDHASQVRVKTESGHVLFVRLDGGGALAATTGPDARVGLVLYDMRNARGEVEKALEGGR